jgi:hypothetical protein
MGGAKKKKARVDAPCPLSDKMLAAIDLLWPLSGSQQQEMLNAMAKAVVKASGRPNTPGASRSRGVWTIELGLAGAPAPACRVSCPAPQARSPYV